MSISGFLTISNGSFLDPPHPLDLNCTAMNKTSVLLTWNKPLVLPGDGIIRGFNINYTDERYRDFFLFKTPTAEFTEAVISSLEPATVYYFQASSRTRKTFGGGGAVVMCQTKADCEYFLSYIPVLIRVLALFKNIFLFFRSIKTKKCSNRAVPTGSTTTDH